MIQTSWLPEKIKRIEPNPTPSADSPGIGVARSHQRYVLKIATEQHPLLPATEWLCHSLAFAVDLPMPHWCVCELPTGAHCFGSRMEGAVLATQVHPVNLGAYVNPEVMGRTFALDMFVGNDDRHPGNWLVTETGGVKILRPIDFSRAMLWRWPLAIPPWPVASNSQRYWHLAATLQACQNEDVLAVVKALDSLSQAVWRSIVESVPSEWLADDVRRELVDWWGSTAWRSRLQWIEGQL